jgi:alkylhydroperoxidase family enzyme
MLDYAVKLTLTPGKMGEVDVERLREVGFDQAAILDICQVVSYYNYVNRMADGLGVELEARWREEDFTLTRVEFEERRRPGE